jgi:tetratricopeptide (TPR) repeat protein
MDTTSIYEGFLSYAHADKVIAAKLHRALESYKIPKGVTGKLSPIFRDTDELTAHHSLSEKIKGAVTGSKVLIVLCSPAAKASHWVNEEIHLFRQIHGEASILCVLAEGTPETSFPPALLADGREPLAANLGGAKDSFRLGVSQIAAAMLGVGLDTLIQRETRRKRRRLQAITAGALIFSGLMGATTFTAVTAQKAAETNRMQAEDLVEYMITDLKEKLEPVGRLDILDSIGDRAVDYYDAQDIEKLSDDSLARQARARHILGQVALDAGNFEKAREEIGTAASLTETVMIRNPGNIDAIYAHAQSEYWVGAAFYYNQKFSEALPHWQEYAELSENLIALDPNKLPWNMERAWSANNIGLLQYRLENYDGAKASYLEAIDYFNLALMQTSEIEDIQFEIANVWAGLANIASVTDKGTEAIFYRQKQIAIYDDLIKANGNNYKFRFGRLQAKTLIIMTNISEFNQSEILELVTFCFREYEVLLRHDPNNKTWRKQYEALVKHLIDRRDLFDQIDLHKFDLNSRLHSLKAR